MRKFCKYYQQFYLQELSTLFLFVVFIYLSIFRIKKKWYKRRNKFAKKNQLSSPSLANISTITLRILYYNNKHVTLWQSCGRLRRLSSIKC